MLFTRLLMNEKQALRLQNKKQKKSLEIIQGSFLVLEIYFFNLF